MPRERDPWERPHYMPGGGDAFLFYLVFGEFAKEIELNSQKYRSSGLPAGVDAFIRRRPADAERMDWVFEEPIGPALASRSKRLEVAVRSAPTCVEVIGTVPDPPTLDYLQDTVGMLTALLETGGVALLDAQTIKWWEAAEWRQHIFDPARPVPHQHVVILYSEEEDRPDTLWLHTRGLRKFGRPDLSVRQVPPPNKEAVVDLLHRFIGGQALGYIIPEGQAVRMAGLPAGLICRHKGDLDDPDFNNVHVEIQWPAGQMDP